jgi:hypothetical protein
VTYSRRLFPLVLTAALAACGKRTAECVVTAFFEDKTDAELKGFFDRPELTPEEATEFAALGQGCASGG